ncbi:TPA: hypothetical protein DDW35_05995 [Candidatus Sumerlaeota bacterium]|jgi:hypothetical protein|nr:hypothetical protein [Candidatus Sumerlaeota bacterium]
MLKHDSPKETVQKSKYAEILSSLYLLLCCVCTAVLALNQESVGSEVKHMFHLPFEVTPGIVWMLIFGGTGLLLLFQFVCSQWITHKMLNKAFSGA